MRHFVFKSKGRIVSMCFYRTDIVPDLATFILDMKHSAGIDSPFLSSQCFCDTFLLVHPFSIALVLLHSTWSSSSHQRICRQNRSKPTIRNTEFDQMNNVQYKQGKELSWQHSNNLAVDPTFTKAVCLIYFK